VDFGGAIWGRLSETWNLESSQSQRNDAGTSSQVLSLYCIIIYLLNHDINDVPI
jgi:hypothetical protein